MIRQLDYHNYSKRKNKSTQKDNFIQHLLKFLVESLLPAALPTKIPIGVFKICIKPQQKK
jgi:hypothetical protein